MCYVAAMNLTMLVATDEMRASDFKRRKDRLHKVASSTLQFEEHHIGINRVHIERVSLPPVCTSLYEECI